MEFPETYSHSEQGWDPANHGKNPPHFPLYENAMLRIIMKEVTIKIVIGPKSPYRKYRRAAAILKIVYP